MLDLHAATETSQECYAQAWLQQGWRGLRGSACSQQKCPCRVGCMHLSEVWISWVLCLHKSVPKYAQHLLIHMEVQHSHNNDTTKSFSAVNSRVSSSDSMMEVKVHDCISTIRYCKTGNVCDNKCLRFTNWDWFALFNVCESFYSRSTQSSQYLHWTLHGASLRCLKFAIRGISQIRKHFYVAIVTRFTVCRECMEPGSKDDCFCLHRGLIFC